MTETENTTTTRGQSIGNGDPNPSGLPDGWIEVNGHRWNLAALNAAIAEIEAHPERHEQENWAVKTPCGTAMCLAGMIVHQAGGVFDFGNDVTTAWVRMPGKPYATCVSEEAKVILAGVQFDDNGDPYLRTPDGTLAYGAANRMNWAMDELFGASNGIEDIKRMRDLITTQGYGYSGRQWW